MRTGSDANLLIRHRFNSDEFVAMVEQGIIDAADRVELIDGEIIDMSPSGPKHAEYVDRLAELLADLRTRARLRVQGSLRLSDETVVDPDLLLLKRKPEGYVDALPVPSDVLLLVEVADASLMRDRKVKAALYAEAGISEYWIVDLAQSTVIVHTRAAREGYAQIDVVEPTGALTPSTFDDVRIELAKLFY